MNTQTIPSVEMRNWMNELLTRADSSNDVKTKVDADGKYIRTPWELCTEIVENITQSAGNMSDKKVLVVDTVEFIPVLLSFGVNKCNIVFVAPYEFKGKIASSLGATVVQETLLTWKTNMKFDVIVGNPPYQNGKDQYFYKEFIYKSLAATNGIVAMITSANWVSGTGKSKKFFKDIVHTGKITHYRYLDTSAFDVQILTAYFICQPKSTGTTVEIIAKDGSSVSVNRTEFGIVSSGITDALSVVSKIKKCAIGNFLDFTSGNLARNKAILAPTGTKAIFGGGRQGQDFDWKYVLDASDLGGVGVHKVVFSKNSSIGNIGPVKYADLSFGCAANAYFIPCQSKTEADNIISYLQSKPIKCMIKTLKHASCTNSKGLFNQLPKVDFTRTWTDVELYAYFGLAQDEIDYIEATIE